MASHEENTASSPRQDASGVPPWPAQRYEAERDVAVRAARRAAHLIRMHAGQVGDVREKGTHDLVTHVDEEAQRLIIDTLRSAFPGYDVLAEEGTGGRIDPVAGGHRWIIDPIDGTTNFTHGVPPYAVSIALQRGDTLVLGVVLDVARDELFTAIRGGGAFANGVRVRVSRTAALAEGLLATGFPYRRFEHLDAYLGVLRQFLLKTRGVRRHGVASIDLAYVACGRFDGFFETGLQPWDVAAGTVLVIEAGGQVTDFGGDGNPVFDRQIVASNGLLHGALCEVLAPLREIRL
ncbi:inositol monophosphatase [Rhodocaloribacter litoris]|uniref:inositol monophosphatase family protein n=1 Tax=Rhodocaloribacter litoris TaxID=2558931 RepID=UPI001421F9A4|nr:inositol monophosphatase family protein [Rhodocaloribacter litoris]QXD14942.1 inositol monophosphatase [Rhodocaloribacter litoris]